MVKNAGQMELITKDNTLRELNKVKEYFIGLMVLFMKAIFKQDEYKVKECINGMMEGYILDNGKKIKCMEKEYLHD